MSTEPRIEFIPLTQLVRWPRNPKLHDLDQIHLSFNRFGYVSPVLVDEGSMKLIAGHGRIDALTQMRDRGESPPNGIKTNANNDWLVPVIRGIKFANEKEAEAYLIADNKLTMVGGFDDELLKQILPEHQTNLVGLGFSEDELRKYLPEYRTVEMEKAEETPPLQPEPVSRLGDLWLCGNHRVLCGDSTKQGDVEKVLNGSEISAILTDPPYGFNKEMQGDIINTEYVGLMKRFVRCLPKSKILIAFHSTKNFPYLLDAARQEGWIFERMLWIYKPNDITFPWRGWILKSEACLVFSKDNGAWIETHPYHHDTYEFNLTPHGGLPEGEEGDLAEGTWHPSIKPLMVVKDIATRIGTTNGSLYDPFLGSGTTLIAAQQLGRTCYGIEIEPRYVDVIVKRWCNLTKKDATLQGTNHTFNQVEAERKGS